MSQSFFNVIRTDEQLGYNPHMGTLRLGGLLYFIFSVSSSFDPVYIQQRFEAFLMQYRRHRMQEQQLNELKEGAVSFWSRKPKCLLEDFSLNITQIRRRQYLFNLRDLMKEHIQ